MFPSSLARNTDWLAFWLACLLRALARSRATAGVLLVHDQRAGSVYDQRLRDQLFPPREARPPANRRGRSAEPSEGARGGEPSERHLIRFSDVRVYHGCVAGIIWMQTSYTGWVYHSSLVPLPCVLVLRCTYFLVFFHRDALL